MDMSTLSFTIALVGAALALLVGTMAVFRRQRGLYQCAVGFIGAFTSFLLFMGQTSLPRLVGVVLANMLLLFYQLSLAWGLRTAFGIRPAWPRRFWVYLSLWLAVLADTTWFHDSWPARSTVSSLFIILGALEYLAALQRNPRSLSALIHNAARAVVLSFVLCHAARIGLLLFYDAPGTNLLDDTAINIYTFTFTLFFSVFWAGLVLGIDAADLVQRLEMGNAELKELATTDELTGLANRHSLESLIVSEMERSTRYREALSLIIFDIDHFKRVNDTHGHQTGDVVLKRLATITGQLIREPDTLFRWGGEEFLILAPHTDLPGAVVLSEKLRLAIAADPFEGAVPVTASFGAAEWRAGDSRELWFKQADQALYRAKNSGRDRVIGFSGQDQLPVAFVRMEWRPSWESGHPLIDDEHRQLMEMANNLLDLSLSQADPAAIRLPLDQLLAHVRKHFDDEEAALSAVGYPELPAHAGLHADLVQEALILRSKFEAGDCAPGVFFDFLVGRVVNGHLLQEDVKYFPYTQKGGLSSRR